MTNLLKNVSIFFGNRINICIIVLMLFIILIYILQKNDNDNNLITYNHNNKKYNNNNLIPINLPEGNYKLKTNNGLLISPNSVDKFGIKLQNNNEYFNNNNFWKIKKNNQYYILDKPDSKTCLSVQNDIIKELAYEDCNKKSLCGIEDIINDTNNDKIKTSYFNIYNTDNGTLLSFNNKYLRIEDNNDIKLTTNISQSTPIIFEKI